MKDVECPYCGEEQDIEHEYEYDERGIFSQECISCEKIFAYNVSMEISFWPKQADCLNGGVHSWRPIVVAGGEFCDGSRECTSCGKIDLRYSREDLAMVDDYNET